LIWLSLIPAAITIVLTFKTKKLIPSLFLGVLTGTFIKEGLLGALSSAQFSVSIFSDIMFTLTATTIAYIGIGFFI